MAEVARCLHEARKVAANDTQRAMLDAYVAHFTEVGHPGAPRGCVTQRSTGFCQGHIDQHKDAQRHWVRDVGPVVESNIGFIESYRCVDAAVAAAAGLDR
jgi:dipeptidyl-peptidase-3